MIDDILLTKKYYLDHMSMFLKGGYGIEEHTELFLEYIQSLNNMCDYQINVLDIWNENYISDLKKMYNENGLSTNDEYSGESPYEVLEPPFEPLDAIAAIVGCKRENVYYETIQEQGEEPRKEYKIVRLSNKDLLELIKISIVQNNYKGTYEEIYNLYREKLGYIIYPTLVKSSFANQTYLSATAKIYINNKKVDGTTVSEALKNLFTYSDLFVKSMGIAYDVMFVDSIENIFTLDSDDKGILDNTDVYLG